MKKLNDKKKSKGFTLLEILMVLVIMSAILALISNYTSQRLDQFKRDKSALQIQQILNAGLSFYINNGYWPAQSSSTAACAATTLAASTLLGTYLPASVNSPYGSGAAYTLNCNLSYGTFSVSVTIPGATTAATNAIILAGMVPLGSYSGTQVTGMVNVPGQNLNNARSVNFAGYYHNGGCVPAPTCPTGMVPDILVVPVSMYGVNDESTSNAYYALYGFTAYAYGGANQVGGTTPESTPDVASNVADCTTMAANNCQSTSGVNITSTTPLYWRVCLSVTTEKGVVSSTADSGWGQYATIMAMTRCVPKNENSGSDFTVWTK